MFDPNSLIDFDDADSPPSPWGSWLILAACIAATAVVFGLGYWAGSGA